MVFGVSVWLHRKEMENGLGTGHEAKGIKMMTKRNGTLLSFYLIYNVFEFGIYLTASFSADSSSVLYIFFELSFNLIF